MSLLERAVSRRDRPPAQLAEVKCFRFQLSTASLVSGVSGVSGSEGAFYVMEALSSAYSLGKETCGCRLSMKHLFLMREQQGQTAMDPSGSKLWTFDASPQPFEIGL